MKLWKYSGTLLTATGVIHTIYALFLGKEAFTEMLNNGLIDSIGENHNLGLCFLVPNLRNNTYSLGRDTSILYQKRTKTGTFIFRLLHSTVHHNRLHSRTNIRFLAFLTASTYYYLFKHEKAVRSITIANSKPSAVLKCNLLKSHSIFH